MEPSVAAGLVSTSLFAAANLPMVEKAVRTRDLSSYSLWSLLLGNVGNAVHTVYVLSLPFGPIWLLHGFYLVTMAVMLVLYLRAARKSTDRPATPGRTLRHGRPGGADRGREALRRIR
ncbi:hypothetical protein [Agrococcus sp. Ld7]|uniref:hypothetical protein n=1 Tax=Agrococcus sp. Ld7 TaxID=649148 RepID=UPI00386D20AA